MRADIFTDRSGWLYRLDYKRLILIAFLFRFILAAIYDITVNVTDRDILFPDRKSYSVNGRYISLLLNGYDKESLTKDMIPGDEMSQAIFLDTVKKKNWQLPPVSDIYSLYLYIIGLIYFAFGYFPLGVRVFNIVLSLGGTFFLFRIAERKFGKLTANLFLLIALFLPTQIGYSITLSKDFLRMFIICFILWIIYGQKRRYENA